MKKILVIFLTLVLVLSFAVPAIAEEIDTSVTISNGSDPTNAPIIKAKWETPDDGDTGPGTQVLPPLTYNGLKKVCFWAVITDPQGIYSINEAFVDIAHPAGYPEEGSFKDQVRLVSHLDATLDGQLTAAEIAQGLADLNSAYDKGLITFDPSYTIEEIREEIEQGDAWIWFGCYNLLYHQPAGDYLVSAYAFDKVTNNMSAILTNYFTYVPMTACEFDFTTINYGNAIISNEQVIGGDTNFSPGDGKPTMRNIGNTWLTLRVMQDDMGFGYSVNAQGGKVWNVEYDARLGSIVEGNAKVVYDPAYDKGATPPDSFTAIPGVIHLCNTWKIDFSIHVLKARTTDPNYPNYSGVMLLECVSAPFTGPNVPHP